MALHGVVSRARRRRQGLRVDPQEDMITQAIRERGMRRRGFPHSTGLSFYQRPESQMLQDLMISKHGWAPQERLQRGGGGGGGRPESDVQSGAFGERQTERRLTEKAEALKLASGEKREFIKAETPRRETELQGIVGKAQAKYFEAQAQELGERGRRELERNLLDKISLLAQGEQERTPIGGEFKGGPMTTLFEDMVKRSVENESGMRNAEGRKSLTGGYSHWEFTTGKDTIKNTLERFEELRTEETEQNKPFLQELRTEPPPFQVRRKDPISSLEGATTGSMDIINRLIDEISKTAFPTYAIQQLLEKLKQSGLFRGQPQRFPISGATRRPIPQQLSR